MFDIATLKDAARPIEGVADLATLTREPRPGDAERRVESLRRFQETFLASLRIDPRYALFEECLSDAMRPHFSKGDWLIVDGSKRVLGGELFYLVKAPDLAPHIQFGFEPRLAYRDRGGVWLRTTTRPDYEDRFVPDDALPGFEVLGQIKGIIGNPYTR